MHTRHPATGWSNFPPPPWSNFGPPLTVGGVHAFSLGQHPAMDNFRDDLLAVGFDDAQLNPSVVKQQHGVRRHGGCQPGEGR